MPSRRYLAVFVIAALWTMGPVAAQPQNPPLSLSLAVNAVAIHPGDAVLVIARGARPMGGLAGQAFGRPVRFWPTATPTEWRGLVGVDLEQAPGTYDVAVQAILDDGVTATTQVGLVVQDKQFSTRRLQVAERFVNPATEEIARIEREAELLAAVFGDSSPLRLWRGPFALPVPGRSTSSFGRQSVLNGEIRARHRGADFRAAEGTPVSAPNAGRVVLAQDLYFTGNTIVIDHGGGLFSLLAHLSRMRVAEGAPVARGDRVGDAGSTGRVTGPHLHWTVRLDEVSVDPLSIVASLSQSTE